MKLILILSALIVAYCQAGYVPASTTLIKQSTSIAHPAFAYSAPVALSYSAPVYHYTPAVYSQYLPAPAHYSTQFYGHHFLPQQPIYAQYPVGVVAQNPQQFPEQQPVQEQVPVQGSSPVIEPADDSQNVAQQPLPQNPPQQSGGSSNNDDDTVSIEAA